MPSSRFLSCSLLAFAGGTSDSGAAGSGAATTTAERTGKYGEAPMLAAPRRRRRIAAGRRAAAAEPVGAHPDRGGRHVRWHGAGIRARQLALAGHDRERGTQPLHAQGSGRTTAARRGRSGRDVRGQHVGDDPPAGGAHVVRRPPGQRRRRGVPVRVDAQPSRGRDLQEEPVRAAGGQGRRADRAPGVRLGSRRSPITSSGSRRPISTCR